jgi:hypothetical protein
MELVREGLPRGPSGCELVQIHSSPRIGSRARGGAKCAVEMTLLGEAGLKCNIDEIPMTIGEHSLGTLDSSIQEPFMWRGAGRDSESATELGGREARELREIGQSDGLIHIVTHEISHP